jgi:hypothetical protein
MQIIKLAAGWLALFLGSYWRRAGRARPCTSHFNWRRPAGRSVVNRASAGEPAETNQARPVVLF